MLTYIYFVKCPGCEDEHFDFFDEAKEFAMSCLSQKPVITQTEINRNDFGECTDHCDLGTVWSWEEAMKDTAGGYTEAEPAKSIFTKDDLKDYYSDSDPEFDALDNSLEEPETSEVSFRKPIPEGMTIEQLVEEMEENEDTVECVGCEELHPKADCTFNKEIGWVCPDCEDRIVKCTWCEDLFDKDQCRYEVDLGWLCGRCEAAIKSRGETLTFREGSYWDFLDEDLEELSFSEMVADSINHLINDLGKDSSTEDFTDDVIKDIENNYDTEVPEDPEKYRGWASAVACEVSRQLNNPISEDIEPEELHDLGNTYDGGYPSAELEETAPAKDTTKPEATPDVDLPVKEVTEAVSSEPTGEAYVYTKDGKEIVEISFSDLLMPNGNEYYLQTTVDIAGDFIVDCVTDEDVKDLSGKTCIQQFNSIDELNEYDYEQYHTNVTGPAEEWTKFINGNFAELLKRHEKEFLEEAREWVEEEHHEAYEQELAENEFDDDYWRF